jgi:hypothetical protein
VTLYGIAVIEFVKNSYKAIIQALEEEIENEDDRGVN